MGLTDEQAKTRAKQAEEMLDIWQQVKEADKAYLSGVKDGLERARAVMVIIMDKAGIKI